MNVSFNRIPDNPLFAYENEDIESWLVEEGIGYFDRNGEFHYVGEPRRDPYHEMPKERKSQ